jgi:outer membrane immunogenic protein
MASMVRKLLLGTTVLPVLLGAALHNDARAEQWEGFYAGVNAGVMDTDMGVRDEARTVSDVFGGRVSTHDLTGVLGVHGGYNWQFDNFVLGIEGDLWWTNAGRSRLYDGVDHFKSAETNFGGSVRGRAGLALDNAHIYVTGGAGYVDTGMLLSDSTNTGAISPTQTFQASGFATFVAGVGAEMKLTRNVSARLEYLEHFLAEERDTCVDCNGQQGVFGGTASILRGGLSYHFGAQDAPLAEMDTAGSDIWSGFYAGLHIGAADTQTGVQEEGDTIFDSEGTPHLTNDLGIAGGLHLGYQKQFGVAVVGVEADYSWIDAGFSRVLDDSPDAVLSSQIDGFGSLRARLGVTSGNALVYATGGIGYVDQSLFAADLLGGAPNPSRQVAFEDSFALVAGAGAEIKLTGNLSARLEYLFYQLDEDSATCATCTDPTNADGQIHFARAGITYHLNGNAPDMAAQDVADWRGPYIGGHLGIIQSRLGIRDEEGNPFNEGPTVYQEDQTITGGLYLGHNHQIGNAVFGIEADYSIADGGDAGFVSNTGDVFRAADLNGYGSLRGRLGLATGNALFYATAGIGYVDASVKIQNVLTPGTAAGSEGFLALVAGAGTEFRFNENWSARAEYLYYGFDEESATCAICVRPAFSDGDLHVLRGGIAYHFPPMMGLGQ